MKEEDFMAKNSVKIRLKAYEHRVLDAASEKIDSQKIYDVNE